MSEATQTQPTWFRGFIQGKTRIAAAWLFAASLAFVARAYPRPPGIAICLLGAVLRYWASGYLRKDSRPAVGGPYAYVRNPLYLGTYLMALGTAAATEAWGLFAAMTVGFAVLYHFIILDEEVKLERIFGPPYLLYTKRVPRFFPTFRKPSAKTLAEINPDPEAMRYSKELARKNKAYEAFLSFLGLIGFVALAAATWHALG